MNLLIAQVAGLFTAPMLAGIGAAAVSIPIIIHLMSRFRRKPEAWGAMRFLIEAYRKQRKRLQIEKLLLLLVRCMVVLIAGLALAGPVLSGCSRDSLALSGGGGRVVYIVIDDALSSQTREAGTTRLQQHKAEALKVIDEMLPSDRAVVVRMARPTELVIDQPTSDKEVLKDTVEGIQPRYSRGELLDALVLIDLSMREENVRDGNAVVVLLSDFPGSADYFEQQIPPELEGFGKRASIVTAMPPKGTDNVQVMSLQMRRSVVVAEPTGATMVGGRVEVLRFGAIDQAREAELEVAVSTAQGDVLVDTKRTVKWPIGERQQGVNFDLPVQMPADSLSGVGQELVVRASLLPGAGDAGLDVLSADDQAFAVVRLRDRLQIALVDDGQGVNPDPGSFAPVQWLRAALTPRGPSAAGPFELSPLMPTALKAQTLEAYDAAIVLRPDEVTVLGWEALKAFTQRGGMLWVFVPAVQTEPDWAQTMKRELSLPWTFGQALSTKLDAQGEVVPVAVDSSTPAPEPLQFLAADWREKLGWVSVRSWLSLSTPEEDRWIQLDDEQAGAEEGGAVLMAQRSIGQGSLLFTATAIDTRFTNLPIRALFVPLMHDSIRGVLGNTVIQPRIVAGDKPTLSRQWIGAGELERLGFKEQTDQGSDTPRLFVNSEDDLAELRDPAEAPGVYKGRVASGTLLLAVNADSAAGDTIGGQRELELLLDKLGLWSYISDQREAGGVLAQTNVGNDLTGALLWALLALVLLETGLARWFSHATEHDKPTVVGRVLGALHGGETAKPSAGGGA